MAIVAMILGSMVALLTATLSYGLLGFTFSETILIYFGTGILTMILTFARLRMSFSAARPAPMFK
ncbi:hypothetical protein [Yoonia sp. 2307UL14-13]|uniref:hypothetical protein n=1 Tax=Yoonia sp. 2307UL14-13 TaxID=3126506 RepID=UPI0030976A22